MAEEYDFSTVTTEELIEELFKRHDHVLICRETEKLKGKYDAVYDFHGGISAAIGLAERFKHAAVSAKDEDWYRSHDEESSDDSGE